TDTKWVTISCGSYHSTALKSDGTLWTWGYNNHGQLGNGNTTNANSPSQVGSSVWAGITGGLYYTTGWLADGTGWTWGDNTYGELGNGNTTDQHSPVQVENSD